MSKILAVGIATIDIINHVERFPQEDDEIRIKLQQKVRGGNATNTLTVLSQFGHQCDWAGVLIDEPDAQIVRQALNQHDIKFHHCLQPKEGKMPTSYITLNEKTGSRTITHFRDCPEFPFTQFQQIDLSAFDWVHFEGRNVGELKKMLAWCKQHYPQLPISLEVEKPRQNIESLFELADVLLFSKQYANHCGFSDAKTFLAQQSSSAVMSCAWGELGASLKVNNEIYHSPAFAPENIVDTLGAGDTFNAGFISALLDKQTPQKALQLACQLAGKKCGQSGFDNLNSDSHNKTYLCKTTDIAEFKTKGFSVDIGQKEAFELFLFKQNGTISGYQNFCPHIGVQLNWEADKFLSLDETAFICTVHGALFKLEDGHCFSGPCRGDKLTKLTLDIIDDAVYLIKT